MIGAALAVAAVLFLVDLALSVMTLAASALSRVALRRLNTDSGGALPFLDEFKVVPSSHRAAIHTVREASLVGGAGLLAWCASELHVPGGYATGLLAGILVGTILLETVIARALALRDPRTALRVTAVLIRPVYALTYPVLAPIHAAFKRRAGTAADEDDREEDLEEDVEAFIEVGEREGIL